MNKETNINQRKIEKFDRIVASKGTGTETPDNTSQKLQKMSQSLDAIKKHLGIEESNTEQD